MRKLILSLTLIFSSYLVFAQQTFTIKVVDAKSGNPVTSASVVARATGIGSSVNNEGVFTIKAKAGDILDVTSVGYQPQSVKLAGNTEITVLLEAALLDLGDIVVVGTRGAARAKTETAVPIDVIKINQVGQPTGRMDLTSVLNMAAPSFNYNKQSGADGADHIDLGTLRGLGPDQTLVLINGKRRHQTAFVGLFGTRGRGNSGADLNAFPQSAVDRIEILRDGASAQYGSDAMAGVMNIILKKDVNHWTVNTGWAGYYDTKYNAYKTRAGNQYYYSKPIDGGTFTFSANNGFTIGKSGGFVNLSFDYLNQAKTYRQTPDTNVMSNKDALPLNSSRRAFGDGSVKTYGAMYNMELPVKGSKTVIYSFGGISQKASDAFAYTRNLSARPDRFPVNNTGSPIFVDGIMRRSVDGEVYYNPHIVTNINDASVAIGAKGVSAKNWNWDFSMTNGKNDFQYFGDKTFNASMIGNIDKTYFVDGGFRFRQATFNLDFSKAFKSVMHGMNIGYGFEYRNEKYSINAGEEASYASYDAVFGQAPGSQGFPGFSPNDTIKATRNSFSAYADAELNVSSAWLLDGAVRFENYSDFGSVATFKLATRLKAADNFNIRGSVSTGFRAPSLQQINFSNTLTSFSGGQLVQSRIARNGDAVTKGAGIPDLKEETSLNGSLGFAWKPAKNFTVTLDGYMVKVKDRIVLSGLFDKDDATLPSNFTSQLAALGVQTAQFFANSVNTTNYGVDVVADYSKKWSNKHFKALLAGNFQTMKVDDVNIPAALNDSYRHRKTFFSDREEAFLLASAPKAKGTLSLEYGFDKLSFGANVNYFGNMKTLGFGWTGLASAAGSGGPGDPAISGSFTGIDPYVDIDGYNDGVHVVKEEFNYKAKITTDLFVSYKFCKSFTWFLGADNIFNVHPNFAAVPNARYESFDNETGGPWESVQMGVNGRRIFTKLAFNF
ncbi:MAG: TonB-dependent receptor [Ferruginibacter sp.]